MSLNGSRYNPTLEAFFLHLNVETTKKILEIIESLKKCNLYSFTLNLDKI